jgi:hypothetical protein
LAQPLETESDVAKRRLHLLPSSVSSRIAVIARMFGISQSLVNRAIKSTDRKSSLETMGFRQASPRMVEAVRGVSEAARNISSALIATSTMLSLVRPALARDP